jgi:ectoine hydroxylase-related dioxygenase (phytanoyl-CoA dioxygenase family)
MKRLLNEQAKVVERLRRNGRGFTADRVAALSGVHFEDWARDLLTRFAADGRFPNDQ